MVDITPIPSPTKKNKDSCNIGRMNKASEQGKLHGSDLTPL